MVDSYYKLSLFMVKHLLTVWFIDVYGGFLSPTRYTGMISLNRPFLPPSLEDSVADTAVGWWIVWRLCCIMYSYIMLYYVILCYTIYYPIIFGIFILRKWESAESEKPAPSRRSAYISVQGGPRRAKESRRAISLFLDVGVASDWTGVSTWEAQT